MTAIKDSVPGDLGKPDWWLVCLLVSVLFTPTFRVPGGIPVRIDDVVVFGTAGILAATALLRLRVSRPDLVVLYLMVVIGTILLSTVLAPSRIVVVTAKEYLDILRPLKFLLVYWILRQHNPVSAKRTFLHTMSISLVALLGIACVEMLSARIFAGGPIVTFFSHFTDWDSEHAELAMAVRPFATFNTPVDLGYVAMLGLFLGPQLASPRSRVFVTTVSFLTVLITVTRTFMFSLPFLLLLQAMLRGHSFKEKLKRLRVALALTLLAAMAAVLVLPAISPTAAEFTQRTIISLTNGDTRDDESIATRLENLELVVYTWQNAPVLGVAARSLLPPFVDSELIMTFHRYGVVGFATLLAFYLIAFIVAKKTESYNRDLAQFLMISLLITFLIGITQAALINSRIGVFLFVILGMAAGWQKRGHQHEQTASAADVLPRRLVSYGGGIADCLRPF
jgi:hypothetical protein